MPQAIRKAVIPVAGHGTRMLPATKSIPKELLTVVDRPVIQYVVDEARAAGIEHIILVTGRGKSAIEDHFDRNVPLEEMLARKGKTTELAALADTVAEEGRMSFTRQQEPKGLGHAVWCARELVGNEPFALLLPDVITQTDGRSCIGQLIEAYQETGGNLLAVEHVEPEEAHKFGIVDPVPGTGRLQAIKGMVEKPARGTEPSSLMIMGRYVLEPQIFDILARGKRGAGGEVQLTDAMAVLMAERPFHSLAYRGRSFDCGSKAGFVAANVAMALARADIKDELREEMIKVMPAAGLDTLRIIMAAMHGTPCGRPQLRVVA